MSCLNTTNSESYVGAEWGICLDHALEVYGASEGHMRAQNDRSNNFTHETIDGRTRSVMRMDGSLQQLELSVTRALENIAHILGCGRVDFGDIVLVGDFVDANRDKDSLGLVLGVANLEFAGKHVEEVV